MFRLQPEAKCRYRPGQFLHLALDAYDPSFNWPESRVFSIANAPGSDFLEILVSQKGHFTQRMIKGLEVEDEVWLKLPYGEFNFENARGKDAILVAGGTGISPFIPFLEDVYCERTEVRSLALYYGIKAPEVLIYGDLLQNMKLHTASFHLNLYVEKGKPSLFPECQNGLLDMERIVLETKPLPGPVYYISGPKAMINAFVAEAQKKSIPPSAVYYDKWE